MASGGYYLADGLTRVPSVTTIIGRFKEAGGLIHWAWKLGKEGKDYRDVRDQAADAGTLAHHAVEMWIKKLDYEWPTEPVDVVQRAKTAFGAFQQWAKQTKLKVTHTEIAMVSERWRFGGRMDAILVQGKRSIGDWKSSASIYPEYLLQIAAYGKLWEETHPDEPVKGGYHLLRFDKEYGDFHAHWWPELESAWEAFQHLRRLYDLDKELKARAK